MTATPGAGSPTPTVSQLRRARPGQLSVIVHALQGAQARTESLTRTLASTRPVRWWGGASLQAGTRHDELLCTGTVLGIALGQGGAHLQRVAAEVAAAQEQLHRAEALARRHGLLVAEDGTVGPPPGTLATVSGPADATAAVPVDPAVARAVAVAVRDALLRYAAAAHLLTGVSLPVTVPDPHGAEPAAPVPPLLADPQRAAAWFAALSHAEQQQVVAEWPEWVGGTDGLPGWARDRANRALLVIRLGQVNTQVAAVEADLRGRRDEPGPPNPVAARALAELRRKQADLLALAQVLAGQPARLRQLLVLDTSGPRVLAAVSTGDVDTAGHLAVFVPGFRTGVASHLAGYDARNAAAADLATRMSRSHGDGRPVVAITWHGYPAPQTGEVLDPDRSVLSDDPAREGAARLAGFVTGLTAAAAAVPGAGAGAGAGAGGRSTPRVVLWGHSYGSVVAGIALRDHRPPVDALAVFGSPGLGVADPRALHLPAGRLYVAEAPGDPVADAAAFGADPGTLPGVVHLATNRSRLPDGTTTAPSLGHQSYLAPGSTSAWNLAAVAAGTPQLVRTTGVCHAIDILRRCG